MTKDAPYEHNVRDRAYTHDPAQLAAWAAEAIVPDPANGRILVAGDFHLQRSHADFIAHTARKHSCSVIVQVGDLGYFVHNDRDRKDLEGLQKVLAREGITLIFIDGNHENHFVLRFDRPRVGPFRIITPNILYAERGTRWAWHGVRFLALGGAASTDASWRLAKEADTGKNPKWRKPRPRTLWWSEETIRPEDAELAIEGGPADVLVCHDCPASVDLRTAVGSSHYREHPETNINRQHLQRVCDATRPAVVWHGHYHKRYSAIGGGFDYTFRSEGLGYNGNGRFRLNVPTDADGNKIVDPKTGKVVLGPLDGALTDSYIIVDLAELKAKIDAHRTAET